MVKDPTPTPDLIHGYQSYLCFAPQKLVKSVADANLKRNSWMEKLQSVGTSIATGYSRCSYAKLLQKQEYGLKPSDYPNSYIANDCSVSFLFIMV